MGGNLPTTPDADERLRAIHAELEAEVEAIGRKHEERILGGLAKMLHEKESPDTSRVVETVNASGETVHRLSSPMDSAYRTLDIPEEARRYRTPEGDHWMKDFLVGAVLNDGSRKRRANAKLEALFPDMRHERADTLEGTAESGSGGTFADGTGGVLLPRVLEALVAVGRDTYAKMYRWATTYNMTTQEHNIPTGSAMTAYMVGEATSPLTGGEPTFAQVPLVAYRGAVRAVLGNDLIEDSAINVVNFITMRGGAKLGVLEDLQFFSAGASTGLTAISGVAYTEAATNYIGFSDLVGMYQTLPQPYRPMCRWLAAADVIGFMADHRDTLGRPYYDSLFNPPTVIGDSPTGGLQAGQVGSLLGRPIHEVPLPAGTIILADVGAAYSIGRRQGIRADVSREFLFDTFRTIFLIHERFAGNNVDSTVGGASLVCSGITAHATT